MQHTHLQLKVFNDENRLAVPATVSTNLLTLSSQCVGMAAIANQAIGEGECTAETVQHIANLAENLQRELQALADLVMDSQQ